MSGVRVSNEYVDDILLAILLHDDIIDWRYFAWRDYAGDILLAIFCWRYFFRTPFLFVCVKFVFTIYLYIQVRLNMYFSNSFVLCAYL